MGRVMAVAADIAMTVGHVVAAGDVTVADRPVAADATADRDAIEPLTPKCK